MRPPSRRAAAEGQADPSPPVRAHASTGSSASARIGRTAPAVLDGLIGMDGESFEMGIDGQAAGE